MHFFINAFLRSQFEKYVGSIKQIKGKGISCLLKRMFLCNHSVLEKKNYLAENWCLTLVFTPLIWQRGLRGGVGS